jgi:hypothetical protein
MGSEGVEAGLGAAIAGGNMDAIVAAGVEGAGAALEAIGMTGVAGATVVAGVAASVVSIAFEAGLGLGFGTVEAGESLLNFGVDLFSK